MNLIALMYHLCSTNLFLTDLILLVTYPYSTSYSICFYSVVLIKNVINIYIFFNLTKDDILLIKLEKCHYKGKNKIPCKSL